MKNTYVDPYFESVILALTLNLLPVKFISYLIPVIILAWFIIRSSSGKVFQKALIVTVVLVSTIAFYYWVNAWQDFSFLIGNGLVAIFTYSTFLVLWLLPSDKISTLESYEKYAVILKWIILVEGAIGIAQFVFVKLTGIRYILPGDAVQGSIGIDAIFTKNPGFGNQVFVLSMIYFIVLFLPYAIVHRKCYYVIGIGVLSIMLAGVLHIFISLLWALLFTIFFYRKNIVFSDLSKIVGGIALAVLLIVPLEFFFPGITKTTSIFFEIYQSQDSPKFRAIDKAIVELPREYPSVYFIGLGPGQYSSRAGLISSGKYYSNKMEFLSNDASDPFKKYFQPVWRQYYSNEARYGNSTMHRPFFSLLSLFTEFGLIGVALFILCILYNFIKIRELFLHFKSQKKLSAYLAFSMGVLLILLFFISTFENYLETAQSLLPGLMLFKVMYNYLSIEKESVTIAAT